MRSNRGPRGIPASFVAGRRDFFKIANLDPQGAWTSQTFTATGTFQVPAGGLVLNKNGKINFYITATAAGGSGGSGGSELVDIYYGQGGQAGQWCRRYKIECYPGDLLTITIPSAPSAANGGSLTVASAISGTVLTLTGGNKGADASSSSPGFNGTTATIVSGSEANENAIRSGCRGGYPSYIDGASAWVQQPRGSSDPNTTLGSFVANDIDITLTSRWGGGGGGGLFGRGARGSGNAGGGVDTPAANGGGGGGGGVYLTAASDGAAGQCLIEWRIAA